MAEFDLVTIWRIGAELAPVWDAVCRCELWPQWWRGLESAVELERGGQDGTGSLQRFVWRGAIPYRLTTDIRTERIEPYGTILGTATGDVEGTGVWRFEALGELTVVRHEWRVRAVALWLRALSAVARPCVRWNHGKIMEWGAHGLARRIGAGCCEVERCEVEKNAPIA
jgi:hypothetical protein